MRVFILNQISSSSVTKLERRTQRVLSRVYLKIAFFLRFEKLKSTSILVDKVTNDISVVFIVWAVDKGHWMGSSQKS